MGFLAILKRIVLFPLEIQALHLDLRTERAKASFQEHIIDTQDVIIRRALHLLTIVGAPQHSMANLRDFRDGVIPVHAPASLPDNLIEEFHQLPPFVQQYIVSLTRFQGGSEGNGSSTSSHDAEYTQPQKVETTSNSPVSC